MSCHIITIQGGKKFARPVTSEKEYRALRGTTAQQANLIMARKGNDAAKRRLVQFNYSLAAPSPKEVKGDVISVDESMFPLKGATEVGNSVGMDIDHISKKELKRVIASVLDKKDELGLLMMERSARGEGLHVVFRRHPEMTNEENLRWASALLGVEFDKAAKDITRVFFATSNSKSDLLFLSEELFSASPCLPPKSLSPSTIGTGVDADALESSGNQKKTSYRKKATSPSQKTTSPCGGKAGGGASSLSYLGIPYSLIIEKWWALYNDGQTPVKSNRDVLTFELAVNLRHICGFDRELLDSIIPCYDEFSEEQKMKCIDSALGEKRTQMPKRLKDVLAELKKDILNDTLCCGDVEGDDVLAALDEAEQEDELFYYNHLPKEALVQGVNESIEAVGAKMTMPVLGVVCPMVGALATDVRLLVHGSPSGLNLQTFVVGDAGSNKGKLDAVVDAWMAEEIAKNKLYHSQEDEFRAKKRAAQNAQQQPDEPHLPVRFLTMNNTVANLADRLANTDGKHAFSFTPEADTVAIKWRTSMCDFSTMLRQAYDGSRYDREAKSADATTVHIDHLYWNVCMCGTPDALYRVISNYTDGLLTRFILARTPDNTYAPLEEQPCLMTPELQQRIVQVAHLLPFMQGTLDLPALEERSRKWVENVRRESLKDDDRVKARARMRHHVIAQRMMACLLLCRVAERLIDEHGLNGAEKALKMRPTLTQELAAECLTEQMLDAYDVLADSLLDNYLYFFRQKIEAASQLDSSLQGSRVQSGKNDLVYDRLSETFNFEQAMGAKGRGCTRNSVKQMLKNWRKQGLIVVVETGKYQKVQMAN